MFPHLLLEIYFRTLVSFSASFGILETVPRNTNRISMRDLFLPDIFLQ